MEKGKNIKELLGMKYGNMAMLLEVNRSQWLCMSQENEICQLVPN